MSRPEYHRGVRALAALLGVLLLAACSHGPAPYAGPPLAALKRVDVHVGDGAVARPGMTVTVTYTGWLYDPSAPEHQGRRFDASADHGGAFSFTLGAGRVIKGWDQGIVGMRVGGERRLLIPARLAYGQRGAGGVIPPRAPLVFDVHLRAASR